MQRARGKGSKDEASAVGSYVYMRTPDGLGRSVLAAELSRTTAATRTEVANTMRNWATVTRLMALLDD